MGKYRDFLHFVELNEQLKGLYSWSEHCIRIVGLRVRLEGPRDGFTGWCGGVHPPSPGQRGCRGGAIFHDKAKNIRDKMRYSNLSNNMMISEL